MVVLRSERTAYLCTQGDNEQANTRRGAQGAAAAGDGRRRRRAGASMSDLQRGQRRGRYAEPVTMSPPLP